MGVRSYGPKLLLGAHYGAKLDGIGVWVYCVFVRVHACKCVLLMCVWLRSKCDWTGSSLFLKCLSMKAVKTKPGRLTKSWITYEHPSQTQKHTHARTHKHTHAHTNAHTHTAGMKDKSLLEDLLSRSRPALPDESKLFAREKNSVWKVIGINYYESYENTKENVYLFMNGVLSS